MKLFKFLLGLLLLPGCVAATRTLVLLLRPAAPGVDPAGLAGLGAGFGLWLFVYFTLPRPTIAYVFGHELTHAIWSFLLGGGFSELRVRPTGGSVRVSESGVLVTLAPYFFPLYTLLVIAAYGAFALIFDPAAWRPLWFGLVGLTWSFHLTFTLSMLTRRQPDILEHGRLFSYALIYLLNVLGVALWVVAVGPASLGDFAAGLVRDARWLWEAAGEVAATFRAGLGR